MDIKYFDRDIRVFYNKDNYSCAVNKSIRRGRLWETKIIDIYKKYINNQSVVLDIGANLGCHTVALSLLSKRCYAFEPQKKIYHLLKNTIEYNKLDNVKLYNNVVSNNTDEVDFKNTGCGRGGELQYRKKLYGELTKETCITIDTLKLDKCDFIKIDVEGGEFKVLEGAEETINKFKPVIILETWKTKRNMIKLHQFTTKNNYSFTYISGDNYLLIKNF
tara:strand:+ start:587 stop:1243 length:657 start_codon:yes stop_codon:yes gene_type:complete